jgi:hypothetical protein
LGQHLMINRQPAFRSSHADIRNQRLSLSNIVDPPLIWTALGRVRLLRCYEEKGY